MMASSSLRCAGVKAPAVAAAAWLCRGRAPVRRLAAGSRPAVRGGGALCPMASVAPSSRIAGASSAAPFREVRASTSEANGLAGMSIPSVGLAVWRLASGSGLGSCR